MSERGLTREQMLDFVSQGNQLVRVQRRRGDGSVETAMRVRVLWRGGGYTEEDIHPLRDLQPSPSKDSPNG